MESYGSLDNAENRFDLDFPLGIYCLAHMISVGKRIKRTPAMAANIIDGIWPMGEILAYPIC